MIWARPLYAADKADPLWVRSGLGAQGSALLKHSLETHVLVTGLDAPHREALVELVGSAWEGSADDTAVVRCSRLMLESWIPRAPPALALAFSALLRAGQLPSPTALGSQRWAWGGRTRILGIVNVTPDSFSDGGQALGADAALTHASALLAAGADALDVGGESTRPGAAPVDANEELKRVLPAIAAIRSRHPDVVITIDTQKVQVAREALQAGANFVNDVSGLRDPSMLELLAQTHAGACVMHMQGTPQTMQQAPRYEDVGAEVLESLELALQRAESAGVPRERLWIDPGIGFGKSLEHNLFLQQRATDLRLLGVPILWGVSRKGFLGSLTGRTVASERVLASATAAALLAAAGAADVVRVHDVAETREALLIADAIRTARDGGARFSS